MPTEDVNVQLEPLLVKLTDVDVEREAATDWGSFQTIPLAPGVPAQQVLGENPYRKNAYLIVAPVLANGGQSVQTQGQTTVNPPIGTVIASVVVPPGTYTINWSVSPFGTAGTAEQSNFQLLQNGVLLSQAMNGSTGGTVYSQQPVQVVVTTTTTFAIVVGPNTPTATAQYRASFSVVPILNSSSGARVGTRGQVMNNAGGVLPQGQYKYEARQEVWAVSDGTSTMNLIVIDHRYK
jgi:hypothetical protein